MERQRGFTMIELLVTLAVAGIALAGVLAMMLVASRTNVSASSTADAVAVAERTIEEARSLTPAEMFLQYEDADGAFPIDHDFNATTVQGRLATYQRRIIAELTPDDSSDVLKIRVEVVWADDGADPSDPDKQHRVALEILRTLQETL